MVLKRKGRDIHDLVKLHVDASARVVELMVLCAKQRDAGDLKAARKTFAKIEGLQAEISELEAGVRPKLR